MKKDLVLICVKILGNKETKGNKQGNQTTAFTIAIEQKSIPFVTSQIIPEDEMKH